MTDPFNSADASYIYRETSAVFPYYRDDSMAVNTHPHAPKLLRMPQEVRDETMEEDLVQGRDKVEAKERSGED